jgi:hypothetical protein
MSRKAGWNFDAQQGAAVIERVNEIRRSRACTYDAEVSGGCECGYQLTGLCRAIVIHNIERGVSHIRIDGVPEHEELNNGRYEEHAPGARIA